MTYMSGWLRGLDAWLTREDVGADAAEEAALITALAGVATDGEGDPDGDEEDEPSEQLPAAHAR